MRTRFAPSPTGFLHVGGLRTALYSYLLAKQTGGQFLLRIEDTDQERSVPGAVEAVLRALQWAGIEPDEGVVLNGTTFGQRGEKGPYFQSERLAIYRTYVDQLLASGHAYHCFCTPERLEQMRRDQEARKQAPMYDRCCLRLSPEDKAKKLQANEPHVVRLKVPHEKTISFTDDIRGLVSFQGHTVDDQVLLKSDGFPTYHMAHVVDDHLMEIDVVIRGEEWLSSLPKHLLLFEALGLKPPRYAHVSLLLNRDRTKLSKRQNSVSVDEYIQQGYLPETLVNFVALLGWNPGTTQELFSLLELQQQFALDRVQKAGAIFDTEKLQWLQGQWVRRVPIAELTDRIRPLLVSALPVAANDPELMKKIALIQDRVTLLPEAIDMLKFVYERPIVHRDLLVNEKQKVSHEILPTVLKLMTTLLTSVPETEWNAEHLLALCKAEVAKGPWKLGQLLWPLRAALTGLPFSPGAVEVATLLGRQETLARLAAVSA